jgi:uncharacterized OB-fold protein
MAIKRPDFPLPDLTDERTAEFFAGAQRGELRIPRCDSCGLLCWYPAAECDRCDGTSFTWTGVSGRGRLFSWVVVERAFLPAFAEMVPFATGLVALEEDPGVRVVSYIVGAPAADLRADQPVEVVFRPLRFPTVPDREVVVPMFTPARERKGGRIAQPGARVR